MIVEVIDTPAPYAASAPVEPQSLPPSWTRAWRPAGVVDADIGGVMRLRPAHIGSATPYADAYPVIEIHVGDRLQISLDDGIKYQAWKAGALSAGPVLEYREAFRDELPRGADRVPDAFEGGGYAEWKSPIGDLETRLRRALTGYQGWSTNTAFDTGGYVTPRFGIGLELRAEWVDPHYTRSYLDLHPQHAPIFSWPHFGPDAYSTAGAQVTAGYRLGPRLTAFAQTGFDRIFGAAWRPPVLHTRDIAVASIGLTWHLGPVVPYGKLEDTP